MCTNVSCNEASKDKTLLWSVPAFMTVLLVTGSMNSKIYEVLNVLTIVRSKRLVSGHFSLVTKVLSDSSQLETPQSKPKLCWEADSGENKEKERSC